MVTEWLPLTDYSTKHSVSVSTLRRRIKANEIKYRFVDGRYLIFDQPTEHRPSLDDRADGAAVAVATPTVASSLENIASSLKEKVDDRSEAFTASASRLLAELKKAYSTILHEREEQILSLKEEVTDLKTLVRVLESENERLKSSIVIYQTEQK